MNIPHRQTRAGCWMSLVLDANLGTVFFAWAQAELSWAYSSFRLQWTDFPEFHQQLGHQWPLYSLAPETDLSVKTSQIDSLGVWLFSPRSNSNLCYSLWPSTCAILRFISHPPQNPKHPSNQSSLYIYIRLWLWRLYYNKVCFSFGSRHSPGAYWGRPWLEGG